MPLLALNRKDTGAESIGSAAPRTYREATRQTADLASSPGKRFHYGGIVAGTGITRWPGSHNGYIAS